MAFKYNAESGLQLIARLKSRPVILNLSPLLPNNLTNEIIEISGNTSTGKTLFLTECVAKCIIPQNYNGIDAGVIYIDLDGQFNISKLVDIINRIIKDANSELLNACLEKLTVINSCDSSTLYVTLQRLKIFLTEHSSVGLIILDSVSANYWQDSISGGEKYMDKYAEKMISTLKLCVQDFKIPIIFTKHGYFHSKRNEVSSSLISRKILFEKFSPRYHASVHVTKNNINTSFIFNVKNDGIHDLVQVNSYEVQN